MLGDYEVQTINFQSPNLFKNIDPKNRTNIYCLKRKVEYS